MELINGTLFFPKEYEVGPQTSLADKVPASLHRKEQFHAVLVFDSHLTLRDFLLNSQRFLYLCRWGFGLNARIGEPIFGVDIKEHHKTSKPNWRRFYGEFPWRLNSIPSHSIFKLDDLSVKTLELLWKTERVHWSIDMSIFPSSTRNRDGDAGHIFYCTTRPELLFFFAKGASLNKTLCKRMFYIPEATPPEENKTTVILGQQPWMFFRKAAMSEL